MVRGYFLCHPVPQQLPLRPFSAFRINRSFASEVKSEVSVSSLRAVPASEKAVLGGLFYLEEFI